MKKKNKILALALSASFVVGGASIVEASADVTSETPQVIEDVASDLSENDNTVPKESASSSEVTEDSQVIPDEIESSQASSNENEVLEKNTRLIIRA